MRAKSFYGLSLSGFHRVAYTEWGDPASKRVAICVHGLTRNGRDFDVLAAALAKQGYYVVCPDMIGRGRSDWLSDPDGYAFPQYLVDMTALIARVGATEVDWIGTSMGGMMGIIMAGHPNSPLRRLLVNDIGPYLTWTALRRIGEYIHDDPDFPDLSTAELYFRDVFAPFGKLTDRQWRHLTKHSTRYCEDTKFYKQHHDIRIGQAFRTGMVYNLNLWGYWDKIRCPTMVLRGVESDMLPSDMAEEMSQRGPKAKLVEIPECGHAPALMDDAQISLIINWLQAKLKRRRQPRDDEAEEIPLAGGAARRA